MWPGAMTHVSSTGTKTMTLIETPMVIIVTTMTMAAAMYYYKVENNDRRARIAVDVIASQVADKPFDKSCLPDGSLVADGARNCLEKAGFRYIRIGLGTVIAQIEGGKPPVLIYRQRVSEDDVADPSRLIMASQALDGSVD